jgi:hypothetical protein
MHTFLNLVLWFLPIWGFVGTLIFVVFYGFDNLNNKSDLQITIIVFLCGPLTFAFALVVDTWIILDKYKEPILAKQPFLFISQFWTWAGTINFGE